MWGSNQLHSSLHISCIVLKQTDHKEKKPFLFDQTYPSGYFDKEIAFFTVYHSVAVVLFDSYELILASVAKLRLLLLDIYLIPFNTFQLFSY